MNNKYVIDKIESNITNKMLQFEVNPIKSNSKLKTLETECKDLLVHLKEFNDKKLKGFNKYAFFICFASFNLYRLYSQRKVLYELESKAINHIILCTIFGLTGGYSFGYIFGNNITLCRKVKKIHRNTYDKLEHYRKRYYYDKLMHCELD